MYRPIFIKLVAIFFLFILVFSSYPEYDTSGSHDKNKEFLDTILVLIYLIPILLLTQLIRFFHLQPQLQSKKSKIVTIISYGVVLIIGIISFLFLMQRHNDNLDKYTLLFPYKSSQQTFSQRRIVVADILSQKIQNKKPNLTRDDEKGLLEWISENGGIGVGRKAAFNEHELKKNELLIRKSFTWITFVSFLIFAATLELFFFIKELGKFKELNLVSETHSIVKSDESSRIAAIQKVNSNLGKTKLKEAINLLESIHRNDDELKEIILLRSRFNKLKLEYNKRQISEESYNIEYSHITSAIIELANKMKDDL